MPLHARLREARGEMPLEELARLSGVSKTYLWELEQDESGEKKPSADVLLKIADALSVTLADLLEHPSVTTKKAKEKVTISKSLREFKERREQEGKPLTEEELDFLATMKFRGNQPRTADDWFDLYLALDRTTKRKR